MFSCSSFHVNDIDIQMSDFTHLVPITLTCLSVTLLPHPINLKKKIFPCYFIWNKKWEKWTEDNRINTFYVCFLLSLYFDHSFLNLSLSVNIRTVFFLDLIYNPHWKWENYVCRKFLRGKHPPSTERKEQGYDVTFTIEKKKRDLSRINPSVPNKTSSYDVVRAKYN